MKKNVVTLENLLEEIIQIGDANKAFDIRAYSAKDTSITDYFLLLSVNNHVHGKSTLFKLSEKIKELINTDSSYFYDKLRISGKPESGWVVIDMSSIIIHILDTQARDLYEIDDLFEQKGVVYHY
jgi:ribosome-associated protein